MRNLQTGKAAGYTRLSNYTERSGVTGSNRSVYRLSQRSLQSSEARKRFSKRLLRTIDGAARCLIFTAFVVAWGSSAPSALADEEIFVTSGDSTNSVRVYNRLGNGTVSPNRTLAGSNTGLRAPSGVAIDTIYDELFVANRSPNVPSITVYDRFADGNTPPKRIISGSATGLGAARGLAIDTTKGKLLVTNEGGNKILIYGLDDDGDVPPQVIAGTATRLHRPWGIVVDHVHNELFVSNKNGHSITVYDLTAAYNIDPNVPGNLTPLRIVTDLDPTAPLRSPSGLAVDLQNDELIVASQGNRAIAVYPRTASGDTRPKRRLSGSETGLEQPLGLILDLPNNELLVSNLSYPRSVAAFTRAAHGNIPPLRTFTLAGAGEPVFLAVTTDTPEPLRVIPLGSTAVRAIPGRVRQRLPWVAT